MKNKIKEIINKHVFEVQDELRGVNYAAAEISQLMCNEVVNTYIGKHTELMYPFVSDKTFWGIFTNEVLETFKTKFSKPTIKTAIENYKSQNK